MHSGVSLHIVSPCCGQLDIQVWFDQMIETPQEVDWMLPCGLTLIHIVHLSTEKAIYLTFDLMSHIIFMCRVL